MTLGLAALAVVGSGCAEDLPGTIPPGNQLHFPIGLRLVEVGGNDLLLVGSSNFDQRFNAGRLFSFSVDALLDLVPPAGEDVAFVDNFADAIIDSVRVDSFSGDIGVVDLTVGDQPTAPYAVTPSRGRNEVTFVRIEPNGELSCRADGSSRRVGLDCTNSHRIGLRARDPFPVAVSDFGDQKLVAVASLGSENPIPGIFQGIISFMTSDYLERRLNGDLPAFNPDDDCNALDILVDTIRGVTALIPLGQGLAAGPGQFLTISFRQSPSIGVVRHTVSEPDNIDLDCTEDPIVENLGLESTQDVGLNEALGAFETRGAVVSSDGSRAYVTVRFLDSADTSNAAIIVMDLTESPVRVITALEVGEELTKPNLDERPDGAKLLYVGDQRFDLVYVINVTTDNPVVAARIESRGLRDFGDAIRQVRLLDQPSQIVFKQAGDRRFAFVSNFSNSTLGIIDVTDPDPLRHRVVARLGRDLNPQGEQEAP